VKVRAYGKLAELLGRETNVDIDVPCTMGELRAHLAAIHPDAAQPLASKRVLACVGDTIVPNSHVVAPGTLVELLAPVSGG
jgi:molybdopterin converting factor small subunit